MRRRGPRHEEIVTSKVPEEKDDMDVNRHAPNVHANDGKFHRVRLKSCPTMDTMVSRREAPMHMKAKDIPRLSALPRRWSILPTLRRGSQKTCHANKSTH